MSEISFIIAEVTNFTHEATLAVPSYEVRAFDSEDMICEHISVENPADLVRLRDCLNLYIQIHNLEKNDEDEQ